MRIAIFGGSFDPVHVGHLAVAEEVRGCLGYDRIVFVPANVPPHKEPSRKVAVRDRIALLACAIDGNDAFALDTFEIDSGGISYTIDTIRHIIETNAPEGRPGLIIGDDLLDGFSGWRDAAEIAQLSEIIVARRGRAVGRPELPAFVRRSRSIENIPVPVSSSEIRNRIATGKPFRYLVPERVYEYITSHELYRS